MFVSRVSCLYYKPMTIVYDNSRVVNKLEASLTDNARVVIYDRNMFTVKQLNLPEWSTLQALPSKVGSWPYPQTFN